MPKIIRRNVKPVDEGKPASDEGANRPAPNPVGVFEDLTFTASFFDLMIIDWIDEIQQDLSEDDCSRLDLGGVNPRELVLSLIQQSLIPDSDFEYPENLVALIEACAGETVVDLQEFDDVEDGETYVEVIVGDMTLGKAPLDTFFERWPARAAHWLLWRTGADVEALKRVVLPTLPDWSREALGLVSGSRRS